VGPLAPSRSYSESVVKRASLSVLAAGLVVLIVVESASSQGAPVTGKSRVSSLQLATLPSIGTTYCREEALPGGGPPPRARVALGIRLFSDAQAATVRFRAGRLTIDRTFGDPASLHGVTSWFRFERLRGQPRVLWLAAVAGGENGYTIGIVRVAGFRSGGCGSVDPPRVNVQIYPRRYSGQPPPRGESILSPWPFGPA